MTIYEIDDNWSGRAPSIKEIAGKVVEETKRQLAIIPPKTLPSIEDMEPAARKYCELVEIVPEEMIRFDYGSGDFHLIKKPRWWLVARNLRDELAIRLALESMFPPLYLHESEEGE